MPPSRVYALSGHSLCSALPVVENSSLSVSEHCYDSGPDITVHHGVDPGVKGRTEQDEALGERLQGARRALVPGQRP